jgi:hypothetical protein
MGDEIPNGTYGVFRWNCVTPVAESVRAANIAVPWTFGIQKSRLYFEGARNVYLVIGASSALESTFTIDAQLEDDRPTTQAFFND